MATPQSPREQALGGDGLPASINGRGHGRAEARALLGGDEPRGNAGAASSRACAARDRNVDGRSRAGRGGRERRGVRALNAVQAVTVEASACVVPTADLADRAHGVRDEAGFLRSARDPLARASSRPRLYPRCYAVDVVCDEYRERGGPDGRAVAVVVGVVVARVGIETVYDQTELVRRRLRRELGEDEPRESAAERPSVYAAAPPPLAERLIEAEALLARRKRRLAEALWPALGRRADPVEAMWSKRMRAANAGAWYARAARAMAEDAAGGGTARASGKRSGSASAAEVVHA